MKFQEFLSFLTGFSLVGVLFVAKPASNTPMTLLPQGMNKEEYDRQEIATKPPSTSALQLPELAGTFPVGTLTYHWSDLTRTETLTPAPTDKRKILIQVWYPRQDVATSGAPVYLNAVTHQALLQSGISAEAQYPLQRLKTLAVPAAPISGSKTSYPVVVFSPGLRMFPQFYLTLVEQLASHGYVVVGITHLDPKIYEFDKTQSEVQAIGVVQQRVADTRFVLNQLEKLNKQDSQSVFAGRLNLKTVGIYGHSLGGATAAEALRSDSRFTAGVGMDGSFFGKVVKEGLNRPFMVMHSQGAVVLDSTQQKVFKALHQDAYEVTLNGSSHYDFSDVVLLSSFFPGTIFARKANQVIPLPAGPQPKRMSAAVALRLINDYTLAFFDRYLGDRRSPLLEGSISHPEVLYNYRRKRNQNTLAIESVATRTMSALRQSQ
jgi:dienelactone hydrolase